MHQGRAPDAARPAVICWQGLKLTLSTIFGRHAGGTWPFLKGSTTDLRTRIHIETNDRDQIQICKHIVWLYNVLSGMWLWRWNAWLVNDRPSSRAGNSWEKHVQTGRLLGLFFVLFGKAFPVSHFSSADCTMTIRSVTMIVRLVASLRWSVVIPDDVSGRSGRGGCSGGGVVVVM